MLAFVASSIVSCDKTPLPDQEKPDASSVITARIVQAGTKLDYILTSDALKQNWKAGDALLGWDEDGNTIECEIADAGDISVSGIGVFSLVSGSLPADGKKVHLIYAPGKHASDIASSSLEVDISSQSQDALPAFLMGSGVVDGGKLDLDLTNQMAIIGLENPAFRNLPDASVSSIGLLGNNLYTKASFGLNGSGELEMTPSVVGDITASCNFTTAPDGTSNATVYFAVCPNATAEHLTLSCKCRFIRLGSHSLAAGDYYHIGGKTFPDWVQLWDDGPKWAIFNVGATITDYAELDPTVETYLGWADGFNTANTGALYGHDWAGDNGRLHFWSWSDYSEGVKEDVCTAVMGSGWKTPSIMDFWALRDGVAHMPNTGTDIHLRWTFCDGSTIQFVPGCTLRGTMIQGAVGTEYEHSKLFLPAAGNYDYRYEKCYYVGGRGCYRAAEATTEPYFCFMFYFVTDVISYWNDDLRADGGSYRAMVDE